MCQTLFKSQWKWLGLMNAVALATSFISLTAVKTLISLISRFILAIEKICIRYDTLLLRARKLLILHCLGFFLKMAISCNLLSLKHFILSFIRLNSIFWSRNTSKANSVIYACKLALAFNLFNRWHKFVFFQCSWQILSYKKIIHSC